MQSASQTDEKAGVCEEKAAPGEWSELGSEAVPWTSYVPDTQIGERQSVRDHMWVCSELL